MYNKKTNKSVISLLFISFVSVLISCKKPGVTFENFQASNLAVFDCWNDGADAGLNFSIDTSHTLHNGSLTFGRILDYLVVYSGNRTAKFLNAADGSPVASANITLENKKVYSLFLTGTLTTPTTVFVKDDVVQSPSPDKYKLRVANMVTETNANYTVSIANAGAPISSRVALENNVGYKSVTAFKEYNEISAKHYDIYAINPGVDTIMEADVLLTGERHYTICLMGQKGSPYGTDIKLFQNVLRY